VADLPVSTGATENKDAKVFAASSSWASICSELVMDHPCENSSVDSVLHQIVTLEKEVSDLREFIAVSSLEPDRNDTTNLGMCRRLTAMEVARLQSELAKVRSTVSISSPDETPRFKRESSTSTTASGDMMRCQLSQNGNLLWLHGQIHTMQSRSRTRSIDEPQTPLDLDWAEGEIRRIRSKPMAFTESEQTQAEAVDDGDPVDIDAVEAFGSGRTVIGNEHRLTPASCGEAAIVNIRSIVGVRLAEGRDAGSTLDSHVENPPTAALPDCDTLEETLRHLEAKILDDRAERFGEPRAMQELDALEVELQALQKELFRNKELSPDQGPSGA